MVALAFRFGEFGCPGSYRVGDSRLDPGKISIS